MRVLGIDPGVNGAGALYRASALPIVVNEGDFFDLPTVGEGVQRELDYAQIARLIHALKPEVVFIEQVNAFVPEKFNPETGRKEVDKWGATSMARFMGSYFALRAIVICLGLPLRVATTAWKGTFGLKGKDKESTATDDTARMLVLQRYPACAPYMEFKYHQHRAEAYLIAVYGARKWRRENENLDIPD